MARSYNQMCALAFALDAIGDRWSLLIVRNLILGPQLWKDLKADLPGIATNLLSQRLKTLRASDIVEDGETGYRLTAAGKELIPIVFAMADWGERHAFAPSKEHTHRLRYLMTSLQRKLKPTADAAIVQLVLNETPYHVSLGEEPFVRPGRLTNVDVEVRGTSQDFAKLIFFGANDEALFVLGKRTAFTLLRKALR